MTAITRRSLIAAFSALTASGGMRINPKAISQIESASIPPPVWDAPRAGTNNADMIHAEFWSKSHGVRQYLRQKLRTYDLDYKMPAHVAGKRSWSDVYKAGIADAEYVKLRQLLDSLDDESTGQKILDALLGQ